MWKVTVTTGIDTSAGLSLSATDPAGAAELQVLPQSPPSVRVLAVLVAHNGATWLPRALAALTAQTRAPDELIAVDTGSSDNSAALLAQRKPQTLCSAPASTGFGGAVKIGLAAQAEKSPPPKSSGAEWLWLLHDDCAPLPHALELLLAAVAKSERIAVAGPKLVAWTESTQLLEVGLTVARSGRRDTGLDGVERDQGQHDHRCDVLAVPSAGMLIRSDIWYQLGGFDPSLPLLRDDIDFCWRAHLAGHRVIVVPQALVADAQATSSGLRTPGAISSNIRRVDRQHALHVALARAGWGLPLLLPWLALVSLGRVAKALVTKAPRTASAEFTALTLTLLMPWRWTAARWRARGTRNIARRRLAGLFTARFSQLRHVVEVVGGWAAGELPPAIGAAPGIAAKATNPVESGPTAEEAESAPVLARTWPRRILRHPMTWTLTVLLGLTSWSWRDLFEVALRPEPLGGGELRATAASSGQLWAALTDGIRGPGLGTELAASPGAAIPAAFGSVLSAIGGPLAPALAFDLLLFLAPLLAAGTAYRAARIASPSRWVQAWAGLAWGASPLLSAMVGAGRIGPVVATVLVPTATVGVLRSLDARLPQRGSSVAATALLLAALLCAVPLLAAPLLLTALGALAFARGVRRAALGLILLPVAILGPWVNTLWAQPQLLLAGPGAVADPAGRSPITLGWAQADDLNLGIPTVWREIVQVTGMLALAILVGFLALVVLAGLAMFRGGIRGRIVLALAVVALSGLILAGWAPLLLLTPAGWPPLTPWAGIGVTLVWFAVVAAPLAAVDALPGQLAQHGFGWRQLFVAPIVLIAILGPLLAAVAWASRGTADPLSSSLSTQLPAVATEAARTGTRTLVLESVAGQWRYHLAGAEAGSLARDLPLVERQSDSQRLAQRQLREIVAELLGPSSSSTAASQLPQFAVGWILLRTPVPVREAERIDQIPQVSRVGRSVAGQLWRVGPAVAQQATRAAIVPENGPALPLATGSGHVRIDTQVPAGQRRRVVLAEVASGSWNATWDGEPLPGESRPQAWQQSFVIPPTAGRLQIESVPTWPWWRIGQSLLVALLVLIALPVRHRSATSATGSAT